MHPLLNTAVKAARKAGNIINRASLDIDLLQVSAKGQADFVTEVDKAAEQAIIDILSQAYPDHGFIAEESGTHRPAGSSDFTWIIDPLDGTTNFIHGFPQYAVSIACQQGDQIVHGVVYDPSRNDLFTATRGRGAFLNERRIRVSRRTQMRESLIGTGFPFRDLARLDQYLDIFKRVTAATAGIRRPGSAALDLAYVAAGRYDAFWEFGLSPWDMAAGMLLVTEAGGLVTDENGGNQALQTGNVVAGNPKIHESLLRLVRGLE
jgi:myo-inositol-1(or 4)-monophosphatase